MIRTHCADLYSTVASDSSNSISIQDEFIHQSNVGLTKYIRWLSRFIAPKIILLMPFITASNLSTFGINSQTNTSLLITSTDSPSSNLLSRSWILSDRQYFVACLHFSRFCFLRLASFLKRLTIHLYYFRLRHSFASSFPPPLLPLMGLDEYIAAALF